MTERAPSRCLGHCVLQNLARLQNDRPLPRAKPEYQQNGQCNEKFQRTYTRLTRPEKPLRERRY